MLETRHQHIPEDVVKDPRQARRFPLVLPCQVTSPYARSIWMAGTTVNMSRTGALVRFSDPGAAEALPKVGEVALLEVDLPICPSFSPRFLKCMTVVVSVHEVATDHLEVALELRRVRVEERQKKESSDTATILQMPTGPGRVQ